MALLTLKDIGKIYVSEGNVSVGIRGVNLSFDRGEFVAVTGKSGSGKSTLLNVISGMDSYEEGELYIENQATSHYLQSEWEEYREKYISFIFQDYNIIESFTVLQNVELALMHIESKEERRARALELIDRVGLTSHIKQKGSRLSGGQKQRTVIARALAKDSPIILADEPTGNLDSATSKEIIELLREVSRDKLLIVVTHNFEELKDCATRHIRIFDGAVESDHAISTSACPAVNTEDKKAPRKTKKEELKSDIKNGFTFGSTIFT
ncbi:MAG: ABC transporter ATP-binding protein, partial [Ruminococcaceae bacterium]|nr:ABC transporter ATP-binding protein [Oscillospiraceae bacterium]